MTLMGKGYLIWQIKNCDGGIPEVIRDEALKAGLSHILVKIADGDRAYGVSTDGIDYTLPVVKCLQKAGLTVWGWHYVYGEDPDAEAAIAIKRTRDLGTSGYVIDAEEEYKAEGRDAAARRYMTALRAGLPGVPLVLCSYRFPNYHPEFPWAVFLEKCDLHMPQVYWEASHNPGWQLRESYRQCNALPNARPYLATGPTYGRGAWKPTPEDLLEFLNTARELGIPAVNFFSWDYCRKNLPDVWQAVAGFDWPVQLTPQPDEPEPEQPPVEPEEPPAPPDGGAIILPDPVSQPFMDVYLEALNNRQAVAIGRLYAQDAVQVRDRSLLHGRVAVQQAYSAFFNQLPAGSRFETVRSGCSDGINCLVWKLGTCLGYETIVVENERIIRQYTYLME